MIENTLPQWSAAACAADVPAIGQAEQIVEQAARLLRLKSRIRDLNTLDDFAAALANEIEDAVRNDAFRYFYQPIVSTTSGLIAGHEALLRWQRGGDTLVPALFLPIAEEIGLLRDIQQRLLDAMPAALSRLAPPAFMSLNWSPRQFLKASAASALIDRVLALGIDPTRIVIELTGHATMIDPDVIYFCVQHLKDSGFQIAFDDFGGPHGSLAYLSRLPIDMVKLDASLIGGIEHSERATRILSGVVDLAHSLGMRVIAKGIETQPQLRLLRRLGCDLLQGHIVGAPAREPSPVMVNV